MTTQIFNRMPCRRPALAGLALAGLVLAGLAAEADAASITVNGIYQESSNVTSTTPPAATACNTSVYCYVVFEPVPAGKQFIATHISCSFNISAGKVVSLTLSPQRPNGNFVERFQFLPSDVQVSNLPGSTIIVNAPIALPFNQRERPVMHILLNGQANILGTCSLSGPRTDIP